MLRHPSRSRVSRLASRLLAGAAVGVLVAGLAGGPALAGESTEPTSTADTGGGGAENPQLVGPQTAGTAGCTLPAELDEVTGIAVTAAGIAVIEGFTDPVQVEITTLDASCAPSTEPWAENPLNPQDLLFFGDALYICDCGDTDLNRATIAMEKVVPGGSGWEIYRFTFPEAAKLNAKAMLLGTGGLPIFLATDASGVTGIFTAAALPPDGDTTGSPLTRAGDWTAKDTGTPTPVAGGVSTVTGAALSPDGTRVVIRTYSDAYEYEVTGGDIATAIQGEPLGVTPLPNEVKGEAITYSADGTQFITASAGAGAPLLTYDRYEAPDVVVTAAPTTTAPSEGGGILSRFSMSQLTQIIGAVGVVGIVLAIAGIIGIRRARRRREEDDWDDYDDDDDDDYDDRRSRRRRGRDRYSPREPAYSSTGFDDTGGGFGQDYTAGYQQGYGAQGYDQGQGYAADPAYGGYQQGYDQGYADPGYADPSYGGQQPGYGGQGYDQGQYGGGQYGGYGGEFDPMQDPYRR